MDRRIIVAGGGASGMCAAIYAARNGASVTIIEKNNQLGKKLSMTGNEEEIEIDMELVADYVCKVAKETNVSQSFDPADIVLMVQADLDFQEQNLS